ncbi:hypothetical protein HaloA020_33210 [Halomonas sp. A020]|nr:hypothetical protein HaloA020_33210 [Halomonas sp. A020]
MMISGVTSAMERHPAAVIHRVSMIAGRKDLKCLRSKSGQRRQITKRTMQRP